MGRGFKEANDLRRFPVVIIWFMSSRVRAFLYDVGNNLPIFIRRNGANFRARNNSFNQPLLAFMKVKRVFNHFIWAFGDVYGRFIFK